MVMETIRHQSLRAVRVFYRLYSGDLQHFSIRVDFHCRVKFTRLNKIEAMYECSRVNVRVERS